ncbi:tRNA (N(6)-L-threonylcarbamoyladenosine(37)-C(2))-methylthiotransferase MtaB [Candidatus Desantisbacteria bacterium]|nr:tRNA (N(6)-L-threonylcarbamoyladenosine(37)-C(2))-methylthiotransferase MtaB [Candidatus Desantisbacteria bacterium]
MKIAFYTLGCKLNQSETFSMANILKREGYAIVNTDKSPHICIINTCTVTHHSDQRCRQMIRKFIKSNPDAAIIVTGCYAESEPDKIKSIPGVTKVIGNIEKSHIVELVKEIEKDFIKQKRKNHDTEYILEKTESSYEAKETEKEDVLFCGSSGDIGRTRAFVKIQDGCNSGCSYCIVPKVRGISRSVPVSYIVDEIKKAVLLGYPEIVLTGVHIGVYGKDNSNFPDLQGLLKEINKICPPGRLRLSSIEPDEFSDGLIEIIALSDSICKHVHIPLQSGSDEILKKMNRQYNIDKFINLVGRIINRCPFIAIGTDIIAGFPGETELMFKSTLDAVKSIPFTYIHVFPYSNRKGTVSSLWKDDVSSFDKKNRVKMIKDISNEKALNYRKKFIGHTLKVVVETTRHKNSNNLIALSDNYLKVLLDGPDDLMRKLLYVKILGEREGFLYGTSI